MKTVQEILKESNIENIINDYQYRHQLDYLDLHILNLEDRTFNSIKEKEKDILREAIKEMCSISIKNTNEKVILYGVYDIKSGQNHFDLYLEPSFTFCKLGEIQEDIKNAKDYDISLSPWENSLGVLVSESPLTQYYLTDALADFVYEITRFGYTKINQELGREKLLTKLNDALEKEDKVYSLDEVEEELFSKIDEERKNLRKELKNKKREEEFNELSNLVYEYWLKYREVERKFILENIENS